MKHNIIQKSYNDHKLLLEKLFQNKDLDSQINRIVELCCYALTHQGKVLFCGNGGSAADAQHLAAELSGRFYHDRKPLFAEALHVNTSYVTAVANDYSYNDIYSRAMIAKGAANDVLIGISTSGNSLNVINAVEVAKSMGVHSVGLTGRDGGIMGELCDICIKVPSKDTPRIQEMHILLGHIICELIEKQIFQNEDA